MATNARVSTRDPPPNLPIRKAPPPVDVSKINYELSIVSYVGKEAVTTRFKHSVLGEFKLQQYIAGTINNIAQRLETSAELIVWDNGRAKLRHRGLRKASDYAKKDIFYAGDWNGVEDTLRAWMRQKYSDIRVDLQLNFKTIKVQVNESEQTYTPAFENMVTNPSTAPERRTVKKESLERMQERNNDEEPSAGKNIAAIIARWRCERHDCRNYGLVCLPGLGRDHYKINSNDLKTWSIAMLSGKATVELPPLELHPMMARQVQKRRRSTDNDSDLEDNRKSRQPRRSRGQSISVYLHEDSRESEQHYRSSSPSSSSDKRSRESHARTPQRSPSSSPSVREIPLSDYIMWHITKVPEDTQVYLLALEVLQSAHVKVYQLPLLTEAQWEKFGIPLGIYMSLKAEISTYLAEKRLGKAISGLALRKIDDLCAPNVPTRLNLLIRHAKPQKPVKSRIVQQGF